MPDGPPEPVAIALGAQGPGITRWRLHDLWQVHLYPYAARAVIGGQDLAIRPGAAGITPPGHDMCYDLAGRSAHTYAHFRLAPGPSVAVPLLVDLGRDYARAEADLREAIPWMVTQPRRAAIRLWDVLARVLAAATGAPAEDLVQRARARIEALLPRPIDIRDLAAEMGCSREHLARMFRARMGVTVVGYVRQRRVAQAMHLLKASDLTIPDIARQVGAHDLQAFNKLLRRESGMSPRGVRGGSS